MKVDAVILAGGKLKDTDVDKAFIRLGGHTLLERSLKTLAESSLISQLIVTSVPKDVDYKLKVDKIIKDSGDLLENVVSALSYVKSKKVLLVASDIPLITSEHVNSFIELCLKARAGVYYPLIPKTAMGKLSSMKRTYFKLDKIEFTGGNMVLLDKDVFIENADMARKIFTNRKSPLKLAGLLGPLFIIKLALGRLSVSAAENKASKLLGAKVKGVITPYPEIGSDVDKEEDLKFITQILGV